MRRIPALIITTAALAAVLAPPAGAATWRGWTLYNGAAPVENGTGTHSARLTSMILPDAFKVKRNAARTKLTFGPYASCRSTGTITIALVASSKTTSAAVLADQMPLPSGAGSAVYGSGARGASAWRVNKASGGNLRAASVSPTRLSGIWAVVRASTTTHGSCHIGGVRESLGYPLADAFATIRANGY